MSALVHNHSLAQTFAYTRTLVQAGITGLRTAEADTNQHAPKFTYAATGAMKAAAIAAGIGLLASGMKRNPKRAVRNALALGGVTFCTHLYWTSRTVAPTMLAAVRKQVSKARDQHWLELNPVDYA